MLAWQVDICQALTPEQCGLVMGGGGAMWTETVDASNLEPTVSPPLAPLPMCVRIHIFMCVSAGESTACSPCVCVRERERARARVCARVYI